MIMVGSLPHGRRRVPPNPHRPVLSPEIEAAFRETDQRSADAYDLVEVAAAKLRALTEGIKRGAVTSGLDCSESVVQAINAARPQKA